MPVEAKVRVLPGADVDPTAQVGEGTTIWHLAQVREDVVLGPECVIARGAYIGPGVRLGRGCKVQNHALVYDPADLADGVFVGPGAVLTNDAYPRAIHPDGRPRTAADWHAVGVQVGRGASIGARAVCVAPVRIGAWATVAAGAVVTSDVPDYALVVGVPARRVGWVGEDGVPLQQVSEGVWCCPSTGRMFGEQEGALVPDSPDDV
jgi:UDP-2-acetamido-3-amino-2,3-dideoxy-glucuronate N-acetyltransferase